MDLIKELVATLEWARLDPYGNVEIRGARPIDEHSKMIKTLIDATRETKCAILVNFNLVEEGKYTATLSSHGFTHRFTSEDGSVSQWWVSNKSPAPLVYSATSSAFLVTIDYDAKAVLIVKDRHRFRPSLPGGTTNRREHLKENAIREAKEEVGLSIVDSAKVKLVALVTRADAGLFHSGLNDLIAFFATSTSNVVTGAIEIDPHEIEWAKWIPLSEAIESKNRHDIGDLHRRVIQHVIALGPSLAAKDTDAFSTIGAIGALETTLPEFRPRTSTDTMTLYTFTAPQPEHPL